LESVILGFDEIHRTAPLLPAGASVDSVRCAGVLARFGP